jgi:hypothetical protein
VNAIFYQVSQFLNELFLAKEVSFIVKASKEGSLHRFISPISPPFVKEVFWFKIAHPGL